MDERLNCVGALAVELQPGSQARAMVLAQSEAGRGLKAERLEAERPGVGLDGRRGLATLRLRHAQLHPA